MMQDPLLVVDDIVSAATDSHPQMWYYPGQSAKILRSFCMASSDNVAYFLSKISEGSVHTPTPEILKKRKKATSH